MLNKDANKTLNFCPIFVNLGFLQAELIIIIIIIMDGLLRRNLLQIVKLHSPMYDHGVSSNIKVLRYVQ